MVYDRHIDKTEEELCQLREIYSSDEVDRFIDGLESGRINSEEKVIEFTNYIRTSDGLTMLELTRLKQLETEGFIEKFATNYNKRYSTCHLLMNKMRSGISRGIHMLERLCEKKRSHGGAKSKHKVINSSKLGKSPYTSSLWGLEHYRESVRTLYNEIRNYKTHLKECIELCLYIIEQVSYIRSHPEKAHETYQKSRRKVLLNNRSVIKRFIDMNADMENDIVEKVDSWKHEQKSMEEICAMLYHKLDEDEYNDWVISEEVMEARRQGITNEERAIWGDDKRQVMLCRAAYSHIDKLQPAGQKEHIGGKFLALLYKWSKVQPTRGLEYWLTYFTNFYTSSGGKLKPVKKGAVKRCLTQIVSEKIEHQEVEKFKQNMDEFAEKYLVLSSEEENNIKKVANF